MLLSTLLVWESGRHVDGCTGESRDRMLAQDVVEPEDGRDDLELMKKRRMILQRRGRSAQ
jgi:hypothetical protein